ncbi:hypothetical protein CSC12_4943 [Klebsiella michiganensis]|nr:hypothetical protein CSC12_4943 [Klebsiella michiganensis]
MILFGLSLVDNGGLVRGSTKQTKSLSPDTASGPPPEGTGRFSLDFLIIQARTRRVKRHLREAACNTASDVLHGARLGYKHYPAR